MKQNARILVVDDEQDLLEILKFNLETEGYEVVTAPSAEDALQLDIASFDLLLLDVMMGGMSGFAMARQLKDNPATSQVPIIFLTARDTENGEEEAKTLSYQGIVMNLDRKTVSVDGEDIPFTKTEFELLHLLLEERGRVFSRQELIERIWPKDVLVLDRTVDVNITRLRKKIGRFAKCIVTRLGFGYYFDA